MKVTLEKAGEIEVPGTMNLGQFRKLLSKKYEGDKVIKPKMLVEFLELSDTLHEAGEAVKKL